MFFHTDSRLLCFAGRNPTQNHKCRAARASRVDQDGFLFARILFPGKALETVLSFPPAPRIANSVDLQKEIWRSIFLRALPWAASALCGCGVKTA